MTDWNELHIDLKWGKLHAFHNSLGRSPVVLLHGFSDSGSCWPRLAEALAVDYTVVMPDLRGHGHSRMRGTDYSYRAMAADIAAAMVSLSLGPAVIMGHSMGAEVALYLGIARPDLVRGIVFEDPLWRIPRAGGPLMIKVDFSPEHNPLYQWISSMQEVTIESLERHCRMENPDWDEAEIGPWAESKHQFDLAIFRYLPLADPTVTDPELNWRAPWREMLPQLRIPAFLLWSDGREDAIVTAGVAAEFGKLSLQGEAVYIPNAGHSPRRDNFTAVLASVQTFLARIYR